MTPHRRVTWLSYIARRRFLATLGGSAVAWPLAARTEAPPVIGYLGAASPELFATRLTAFRRGLGEHGYVESRNVAIEYRWAEGHYDRFLALASDLLRRQVSVIAAPGSTPAALAAKAATTTVPIERAPPMISIASSPSSPGCVSTG
jgi:ABC-type uncharacterized transport system substrate-binding protein